MEPSSQDLLLLIKRPRLHNLSNLSLRSSNSRRYLLMPMATLLEVQLSSNKKRSFQRVQNIQMLLN